MANESRINLAIHRSLQCLADVYRVRRDLFREMNRPIWPLIKPDNPNRRSLTDKELELIIEFWGLPDKDYCFGVDPLVYRTIRRLSVLYHVSVPTMRQWIKKILPGIKPEIKDRAGGFFRQLIKAWFYIKFIFRYCFYFFGRNTIDVIVRQVVINEIS